eukprot:m.80424 g.80424  ORF g.80424 m.80424 type:complete len:245 (+) comp25310_c1_seq1:131-865(+)
METRVLRKRKIPVTKHDTNPAATAKSKTTKPSTSTKAKEPPVDVVHVAPVMSKGKNKMQTFIALLRGVNVGGARRLPMKEWKEELTAFGFESVSTYIQSGNAIFRVRNQLPSPEVRVSLATKIAQDITKRRGYDVDAMVIDVETLRKAVKNMPFPTTSEVVSTTVHLYFILPSSEPFRPTLPKDDSGDSCVLIDDVLYVHTPNGFGNSKFARSLAKGLNRPATARNWRSVNKILDLANEIEPKA